MLFQPVDIVQGDDRAFDLVFDRLVGADTQQVPDAALVPALLFERLAGTINGA